MHGERNAVPCKIYGNLDKVVRSDLHYHYSSPVCAQRWLDVCEDPAYGHQGIMKQVEHLFPSMMDALKTDRDHFLGVSLISLGPGDGALDEQMLRCLDDGAYLTSYCGLDFSFELLRHAVHRIAHADGLRHSFPIWAVCGDFTDLAHVVPNGLSDEYARIFTLTGFTLGNYQECDLLKQIGGLMRHGDYLFLDARLHDLGAFSHNRHLTLSDRSTLLRSYDLSSVKRFVFGPVEVATFARTDDVEIHFDVTRAQTRVPNALNILIYCTGLNTKMRLTDKLVYRDRLDLAVTALYHYPDLASWLRTMGFTIVWTQIVNGVAMFLLRHAPTL